VLASLTLGQLITARATVSLSSFQHGKDGKNEHVLAKLLQMSLLLVKLLLQLQELLLLTLLDGEILVGLLAALEGITVFLGSWSASQQSFIGDFGGRSSSFSL
jgi:flagellar biosynthesis protein FliR